MGQTQEASKQEASRSSCASVYSRLVTAVAYVIWLVAFLTWGGVTLHENAAISDNQACGKTTHMLKYITLNIVFISGVFLSYLLFPGAGEGARARATLLLAVHGALAVWGMLLWTSVEGTCRSKLSSIFPAIVLFEHVCIAHNSVFFLMFLLHESYWAPVWAMTTHCSLRKAYLKPRTSRRSTRTLLYPQRTPSQRSSRTVSEGYQMMAHYPCGWKRVQSQHPPSMAPRSFLRTIPSPRVTRII